jgi:hypothetical protein
MWYYNVTVQVVYARNHTGDVRVYIVGQGWRSISGPADSVTNMANVITTAAANNRHVDVYIGSDGSILSAEMVIPP